MFDLGPNLPGAELVASGLADLARDELTVEALLVAVGAPRLRDLGVNVPPDHALPAEPELALYRAVGARHPHDAHGQYNALVRRLVSFERALEAAAARQR